MQPVLPWRHALPALLIVLGALLISYRDTVEAMVTVWRHSDTFAHAFLVLPIVVWLVWRKRDLLAAQTPRPSPWVLLPMAALAFGWLLGDLAAVNSVTQLTMTALLVTSVTAILGFRVAQVILFPLTFLFFAVPIGEFLLPQLMSWTADFTVLGLRASGIPVFREGNELVIPSGQWSVVEACSGVRYLIASFMVGSLFAYLHYRSTRRRWIFAAIAILVPIVANWVRAYLIVLLGHLSDNKIAVGVDHLVYGWLFFGIVMCLMFGIGRWWTEPRSLSVVPSPAPPQPLALRPARHTAFWVTGVLALTIGVAPHVAAERIGEGEGKPAVRLVSLGVLSDAWQPGEQITDWKPSFQNTAAEASSTYSSAGRKVGVYIGYYRLQNYHRKLVSSDNDLVRSEDPFWVRASSERPHTVQMTSGDLTVRGVSLRRRAMAQSPEARLQVWKLYWVGNRLTSNDYQAKVYTALDRLLHRNDDAAVVVLYTNEDEPNPNAVLESFVRANLGSIVARLRATRDASGASIAGTNHQAFTER